MDEKEVEKIRKETKELLDKFSKVLASVKVKEGEEWNVERERDRREEKDGRVCDETFRQVMFENASLRNEDFIMAEKKSW